MARHGAAKQSGGRRLIAAIGLCLVGIVAGAACRAADESAVARLTRALVAEEAADGKTSPYLLPVIEQLAQAHRRDGALAEATALRRRALDIAVAAFGCDAPSAAEAMVGLALLDIDQRRYLDAEPLLIAAERVLAARVDADHPARAAAFAGLARIALANGDTGKAVAWARQATAIARRNPHGRSAEPLRALGAALTAEQDYAEAEQVLEEALALDRRYHGADGGETARSLSQLAQLHLRRGRPRDALPLAEEAVAIDQQLLGPAHPFIADDFSDLGLVYDALQRPREARSAFLSALGVLERGVGRDTPRVAYAKLELSRLDRRQGDDKAAETAFRDARRILNKAEAEERRRQRNL